MLIFFLIFVLLVLTIYSFIHFLSPNVENYISSHKDIIYNPLDKIFNDIENGDIILLSGNTYGEKICRYFSGSIFSHVGFLFREIHPITKENIIYIFDCDLGQGYGEGVRIMPLREKLDRYHGFRIGCIRKLKCKYEDNENYRPSNKDILNLVGKYKSVEFDGSFLTWVFSNYPVIYSIFKDQNRMFCSELVTKVYQDLKIMKENGKSSRYHPGDFFEGKLSLNDRYFLEDPKFFLFPKSKTKEII